MRRLIADSVVSFTDNCVTGIEANAARIQELVENSLLLVTALNPHIGYDNAAKIAKKAFQDGTSLKQAGREFELISAEDFDRWVWPEDMLEPRYPPSTASSGGRPGRPVCRPAGP